jgi:hypothetical protein
MPRPGQPVSGRAGGPGWIPPGLTRIFPYYSKTLCTSLGSSFVADTVCPPWIDGSGTYPAGGFSRFHGGRAGYANRPAALERSGDCLPSCGFPSFPVWGGTVRAGLPPGHSAGASGETGNCFFSRRRANQPRSARASGRSGPRMRTVTAAIVFAAYSVITNISYIISAFGYKHLGLQSIAKAVYGHSTDV